MSKIKATLRAKKIVNVHELLWAFGTKEDVAVSFRGADNGRGGRGAYCHVWSPRFQTDPNSHWRDYGKKTFHGKRGKSLPEAMAWATKTYYGGVDPIWTPSPTGVGDYVPKRIADAAKKFAREP